MIHLVEVLVRERIEVGDEKPQIESPGPDIFLGLSNQKTFNVVTNGDQTFLGIGELKQRQSLSKTINDASVCTDLNLGRFGWINVGAKFGYSLLDRFHQPLALCKGVRVDFGLRPRTSGQRLPSCLRVGGSRDYCYNKAD